MRPNPDPSLGRPPPAPSPPCASGFVLALGMVIPVSCWAMERFGAKQMWMYSARNCISHKCPPPGSESPDSRDWMSAVTESGGWSASTVTRMPRSV
jgi:hypothetical protein